MAVGDASSGFLSFHQVAPGKELLMKKILNPIILKTDVYCVVDLMIEYPKLVGGFRYVIISDCCSEELLRTFGEEIKKYKPFIITGTYYLDFLNKEFSKKRAQAYEESVHYAPYSIEENTPLENIFGMTTNFEEDMKQREVLAEEYENVREAVSELNSTEMKRRVKKYYWDNKTQSEIADEEGVSQKNISKGIKKAEEKIKKIYKRVYI